MKRFVLLYSLARLTLLSCVTTAGWGQQLASARLTRPEPAEIPVISAQYRNPVVRQMKPLVSILQELERRHQVIFDYDSDLIRSKSVSISGLAKQPDNLERTLTELLEPLDLTFEKFNSRSYLIYAKNARPRAKPAAGKPAGDRLSEPIEPAGLPTVAHVALLTNRPVTYQPLADRTVTGTITDGATNGGLPGVNVVVKGTSIGTTTDASGQFRINVPDGRNTLVLSYIGYVTQEVSVEGRSALSVTMTADERSLNEVVVVGYGTQKRSDLTGAVASVKSSDLKNLPPTDLTVALQGRVPGAYIQQNDGSPSAGANISIRGPLSINGGSPLYVVDGVPFQGTGFNFNIQDIESIDVLKDASAAAIYGAKAAGGVILITTKKGKSGQLRVSFNANYGVRNVINLPQTLRRDEYIQAKGLFGYNTTDLYGPQSGWSSLPNTNWFNELFRQGTDQNYTIGLTGGGERSTFYLSGNYTRLDGTHIGNARDRYTFRLNSDHKLSKRFTFSQTLYGYFGTESPANATGQGILSFRNTPVMAVYDPTNPVGGWGKTPKGFQGGNDVAAQYGNYNRNEEYQVTLNGTLDALIVDGLHARATLGIRLLNQNNYHYTYAGDFGGTQQIPEFSRYFNRDIGLIGTYTLNYGKTIGKHEFKALGGYEARQNKYANLYGYNKTPLVDLIQNFDLVQNLSATNLKSTAGYYDVILSQFGRVEYNYAGKYLLTANVRRDGNATKFGPANRYGVFPGVAAGWKFSDESFMRNLPALSFAKLRASYGVLGNSDAIGDYLFAPDYSQGYSYAFDPTVGRVSGITLSPKLANPDVQWETVATANVGLDAAFFNNTLNVNLDYYDRQTRKMLYRVPISLSSGIDQNQGGVPANIGQMSNRGFEFNVTYQNRVGSDFTYSIGLNGAKNVNKLISLNPSLGTLAINAGYGNEFYGGATTNRSEPGRPIGQFYGYIADGIYAGDAGANEQRPVIAGTNYTPKAGDLRYRDLNGDGKIDDNDRTYIGNPWPKLVYGINLTAGWKGFDARVFFNGVYGNQIYNAFESFQYSFFGDYTSTNRIFQTSFFGPNGTLTDVPSAGTLNQQDANANGNWSFVSSYHVQSGSYLRLRNAQIGYTIPRPLLTRFKVSSARVFVMADNLFTITNYKGINPDIPPLDNNILRSGVDNAQYRYPVSRLISFGLNLEF